jgi:hypothetical protein
MYLFDLDSHQLCLHHLYLLSQYFIIIEKFLIFHFIKIIYLKLVIFYFIYCLTKLFLKYLNFVN